MELENLSEIQPSCGSSLETNVAGNLVEKTTEGTGKPQ